ncbi:MAG: WYL domain-containing protein [Caldilineaceae bacterium]|nr:WYL domain-containing protein [Caldilineaceae bacterium]MBP8125224.1 WYL domain-containing protein [Caldilineaceae bacterium]
MTSSFETVRRSLSLFRRLQRGPTDRETLMAYVEDELRTRFYSEEPDKARKRLENDLKRLRDLGISFEYIRADDHYRIVEIGHFRPLSLAEPELTTLAFLIETFQPGAPNSEAVQSLLARILGFLPDQQQGAVEDRRIRLRVDLRSRDRDIIAPRVHATIDEALAKGRLLEFDYHSPGQADGVPRTHTVEPWGVDFDTARGHLYLDGYMLKVNGPHGLWRPNRWQRYRLGRIDGASIRLLPDKRGPTPPKRPAIPVEYKLAPEIARTGQVTHHFENTEVHERDADGWVRVTATTSDAFRATRLLLSYGPGCVVLGGEQVRSEMARLVRATGLLYAEDDKIEPNGA